MNTKRTLIILFVLLAQALAACGTEAPTPSASEPIAAPQQAAETVDPAAIAQNYYQAFNAGDIEAAMALVADDIKCRGGCYLTGKESFRSYVQGDITRGHQVELSDLQVDGDKVTYNVAVFSKDGFIQVQGVETLQIEDGLIVLMEGLQ